MLSNKIFFYPHESGFDPTRTVTVKHPVTPLSTHLEPILRCALGMFAAEMSQEVCLVMDENFYFQFMFARCPPSRMHLDVFPAGEGIGANPWMQQCRLVAGLDLDAQGALACCERCLGPCVSPAKCGDRTDGTQGAGKK